MPSAQFTIRKKENPMILELSLEHSRYKDRNQKLSIFGIDGDEVAKIISSQGARGLRGFVSEIIAAKLPSHYYNFEVVDWALKDS